MLRWEVVHRIILGSSQAIGRHDCIKLCLGNSNKATAASGTLAVELFPTSSPLVYPSPRQLRPISMHMRLPVHRFALTVTLSYTSMTHVSTTGT